MSLLTLWSQTNYFKPAASQIWLDYSEAFLLENAHRHTDRLFRHAGQERKVSELHSLLIEDAQEIGID